MCICGNSAATATADMRCPIFCIAHSVTNTSAVPNDVVSFDRKKLSSVTTNFTLTKNKEIPLISVRSLGGAVLNSSHYANQSYVFAVLKKVKHRIVEHMSSSTADSLGLSRAILCNGKKSAFERKVICSDESGRFPVRRVE